MKTAYNDTWVYNLAVVKEAKRWSKHGLIDHHQRVTIDEQYKTFLYHPNFIIRILLFVATLIALSGATGLFFLLVVDAGKEVISCACILYGLLSFFVLEKVFLKNNHYKSGVTEAVLYHACGFVIGGAGGLSDFNVHVMLCTSLVVLSFSAIRYIDLFSTLLCILSFAGLVFYELYMMGGIVQQIIPFAIIGIFTAVWFLSKDSKKGSELKRWRNNLLVVECASLVLIYLGGNYLVVRELSVAMLNLIVEPGNDIPFAFIFYALTVIIPILYLYVGIKKKDVVMLRASLVVIAFSAFTFKYYYSLGHPEITLTIAGAILIGVSLTLLKYLKTMRYGFTRENLLTEKWGTANMEAIIISQTMGGNQQPDIETKDLPGGGSFGGGGSSATF
jgi:branched-subunit amino acid transport protein